MPTTKARRTSRSTAKRPPARPKRARPAPRAATRPAEAWITDPQALLAALAAADRAQHETAQPSRAVGATRHTPEIVAPVQTQAEPAPRDHERIGRSPESGTVIIIRRRPAA
jgi:hypothetical protein